MFGVHAQVSYIFFSFFFARSAVFANRKLKKNVGPKTKKKRSGRRKKREKNVNGKIAPKLFPGERSGAMGENV